MAHEILVVEDDPNMRHIVVDTLEDEDDYVVQSASCVQDALKLAKKTRFELLITDVRMPGKDGIEGFVELKKLHPQLKCIVMTGYADASSKEFAVLVGGVVGYLFKPFSLNEFSNLVEQAVNDKKWALFYSNVIKNGPFRALGAIFRALKRDHVAEVNESRARVFEALFLAIASDNLPAQPLKGGETKVILPKDTANGLYFQLDERDSDYEQFLTEPNAEKANELLAAYQRLYEVFAAFIRNSAPLVATGRLDRALFNHLYQAIQSGSISMKDFMLAPALRSADPMELALSPELSEMKKRVWG